MLHLTTPNIEYIIDALRAYKDTRQTEDILQCLYHELEVREYEARHTASLIENYAFHKN